RESGVRNLEREIASVIRKIVVQIVKKKLKRPHFVVNENDLITYLGAPKFKDEVVKRDDEVGRVTGLAWTRVGGVTLDIEIALIRGGKGEVSLTGSMGDVMKESAKTALSLIKSRAEKYGIDQKAFSEVDIHIHIPEGATPKDGPSAGITLSTAIYSAFTGKKVRSDVAMTGEITLLGRVLAIGGLKEKSLAALRNGVKTLIIPGENEKDIKDIPEEVKSAVKIVTVKDIDEVLSLATVD
ncbi:MAG: endopeptidase La, partial [Clostridia bacterium]|nr:endopeptidase La [Clostridia bacterium]